MLRRLIIGMAGGALLLAVAPQASAHGPDLARIGAETNYADAARRAGFCSWPGMGSRAPAPHALLRLSKEGAVLTAVLPGQRDRRSGMRVGLGLARGLGWAVEGFRVAQVGGSQYVMIYSDTPLRHAGPGREEVTLRLAPLRDFLGSESGVEPVLAVRCSAPFVHADSPPLVAINSGSGKYLFYRVGGANDALHVEYGASPATARALAAILFSWFAAPIITVLIIEKKKKRSRLHERGQARTSSRGTWTASVLLGAAVLGITFPAALRAVSELVPEELVLPVWGAVAIPIFLWLYLTALILQVLEYRGAGDAEPWRKKLALPLILAGTIIGAWLALISWAILPAGCAVQSSGIGLASAALGLLNWFYWKGRAVLEARRLAEARGRNALSTSAR